MGTRNELLWPFTGLLLAMFMAALDQTIIGRALPTIAGATSAGCRS